MKKNKSKKGHREAQDFARKLVTRIVKVDADIAELNHMMAPFAAALDIFADRMKYIQRVRESAAAEWECNPEDIAGTVEQVLRELHGPDHSFSWRDIPEGVLNLDIQSRWTDPRTQGDAA